MSLDIHSIQMYLRILQIGQLPGKSALALIQSAAQNSQAVQTSDAADAARGANPVPPIENPQHIDIHV